MVTLDRRSFLRLMGAAIGTAVTAPSVIAPTQAAPAPAPAPAVAPTLTEKLLQRDYMFGRPILVRSFELLFHPGDRVVGFFFDEPHYTLNVDMFVDPPNLAQHAHAAMANGDDVPIELAAMKEMGIDQPTLRWRIARIAMHASAGLPYHMVVTLNSYRSTDELNYDDSGDSGVLYF